MNATRSHSAWHLALLLALLGGSARAQWSWDQIDELGVKYLVHDKLKRLPLKLGASAANLRARYEPGDPGDYIHGRYGPMGWYLRVYEFHEAVAVPITGQHSDNTGQTKPPQPVLPEPYGKATSFEDFVQTSRDPTHTKGREFKVKGEEHKANHGRGERLPYRWWEYLDTQPMRSGSTVFQLVWFRCAAVYQVEGQEIALVADIPCKKGDRPERRYLSWARRMLLSLSPMRESDETGPSSSEERQLYRWAEEPERRAAVDKALANIKDLDNWKAFTTPNYIVLYSWPAGKNGKRSRYYKVAREIAIDMDAMRELYKKYYPLPEGRKLPYSVMRICSTREEFHKYGGTGGGVAGWFSPASKELVLFHDRQIEKAVAFHEGWHQYADTYFGGVELHRWFDEGTGDFFGSFERKGKRWDYETSKMRKLSIKTLVNTEKYVPLNEIVNWNKDKFYGPGAANFYAEGYAIVDFLRNGKKNRAYWNEDWDGILDTYRKALLETKDQTKAVEQAFGQVDWPEFTRAWVAWVKRY